MRKPIITEVGIISGRDAIFLDEQKMVDKDLCAMVFVGELNGNLCSNNTAGKNWIPYRLSFRKPIYFACYELDLYYDERSINSSFDIVTESDLLASFLEKDFSGKFKDDFNHFVLATYDYAYEIIACDFMLELDTAV